VNRHLVVPLILGALAAGAQTPSQPQAVRVVVPVAGTIDGVNNVRWKTALDLVNDSRTDVTVAMTMMTAPDQPALLTTIGAGDVIHFNDVAAEAFGVEQMLSPLVVETLGRRSVTIRASAYGVRGTDVFKPEPIAVNYGAQFYPIRVLNGLSFSDTYRTNVGLVNLGEQSATFVIALQRLPGRNVAVTRVVLPPNALWHASIQSMFPLITKGDDFSLVVETGHRETYVYASVIDNETNSANFVQAQVGVSAP
jgi:hypothetical protein